MTTLKATALLLLLATLLAAFPAAAQPKPPVLIGMDAEFGHLTSTSDDAIKMGILTAIDEVNAAGGVLSGRPLKLVERDSRSNPARGRANFAELAQIPDIVGVFVGKYSPVAVEQVPLANALGLPLLDPWAAADEIISNTPAGTYSFRLSLRDSWAIPAMLAHLKKRGIERVGVMLPNSGWGRSNETSLDRHTSAGLQPRIVATQWYNWGAKTLAEQYEKLLAARAQAVLFVGNEGEGAMLVNELAALPASSRLPVVSHWGVTGGNFTEMTGRSLHSVDFSVVQTFTFNGRTDAKAKAVIARAEKLFNFKGTDQLPSQAGFAHAYDLTHILARAVNLARSTKGAAVRDALEKVKNYNGLVDRFAQPFTAERHEALSEKHVFLGRFTAAGSVEAISR